MTVPSRPVLRYHGGKWRMASWIVDHMPDHRIYVEVYGGAASVLLQKPRVYAEVYNDLYSEVVNVFRVLRDPVQAEQLRQQLELTPFAREEFDRAHEPCEDLLESARRTIVRAFLGFGSASSNMDYTTGFRGKSFRSGTSPAWDWRNYPATIPAFVDRLRGVAIENRPALELIAHHDREDVLFYCDPPYVRSTRVANTDAYAFEMSDADHEALAERLHAVSGMVVLSGYDSPLYRRLYPDWPVFKRKVMADKAVPREECLWLSPRTAAELNRRTTLMELAG